MPPVAYCYRRENGASSCSFQCADCESVDCLLADQRARVAAIMNEAACKAAEACRDEVEQQKEQPMNDKVLMAWQRASEAWSELVKANEQAASPGDRMAALSRWDAAREAFVDTAKVVK